ncbi:MAG: circularly permuted type 2 ATP-grasp protein [Verrucomicrobiales bacterium]
MPEEIVNSAAHFRKDFIGVTPPKGIFIHICGTDLIRDRDGNYLVLEDNARCPSGASYVLENRRAMKRALPRMYQSCGVQSVSDYGVMLRDTLLHAAPAHAARPSSSSC